MSDVNRNTSITSEILENTFKKWSADIIDTISEGIEAVIAKFEKKINARFDTLEDRLDKVELGQSDIQRQLNDLKVDTPTQKEFVALKEQVAKHTLV